MRAAPRSVRIGAVNSDEEEGMFKQVRSRITPATVISTIALFAALSGGYAVAFSGSGSLQKGADTPGAAFTDVRTLTDFGALQHQCNGTGDGVNLRFRNSGSTPLVALDQFGNQWDVPANGVSNVFGPVAAFQENEIHLTKVSTGKAQVVINVMVNSNGTDCFATKVAALNTQE
jgi:hypothetical protein